MTIRWIAGAIGAAMLAASPAGAQTYNFADFGNDVFSYGSGTTGLSFTPFSSTVNGGCFGVATFTCSTTNGFPVIGVNTGSSTVSFQTVDLPTNTLYFHPGPGLAGQDAILAFTAPTSGVYTVDASFFRLDRVPNGGNGVLVTASGGAGFGFAANLSTPRDQGFGAGFNSPVTLSQGQQLFFGVNNFGEYSFDSTGLTGSISLAAAVPEPATWGMMIVGFGAVGGVMRRRKTSARIRFA